TGLIKANFPSRIAFQVASKTDSRIIIDQMGAEKLLGRGDMLFTSSWNPFPSRVQGAFLSEDDVERVVAHVKTLGEPEYISDEIFFDEDAEEEAMSGLGDAEEMDPLFDKAVEIVRTFKKASASFLQRRLGVGYNRAARMVELMEEMGIVGPQQGSKPREIVHS
ncbi:MAG: DNA translocase FtsK, partial [Spirochaetales bacterium]